jgi:hypothetical protein
VAGDLLAYPGHPSADAFVGGNVLYPFQRQVCLRAGSLGKHTACVQGQDPEPLSMAPTLIGLGHLTNWQCSGSMRALLAMRYDIQPKVAQLLEFTNVLPLITMLV